MLIKLLPSHLHVSAMAIGTALGAGGSTAFPIAAGEIAYHRGYFPPSLGCRLSFLTDYQDFYDSPPNTRDLRRRIGPLVLAPGFAVEDPVSLGIDRGNDCSGVVLEIAETMVPRIGLESGLRWDRWGNGVNR